MRIHTNDTNNVPIPNISMALVSLVPIRPDRNRDPDCGRDILVSIPVLTVVIYMFAMFVLNPAPTIAQGAEPELISDISAIPQLDMGLYERIKAWVTHALRA